MWWAWAVLGRAAAAIGELRWALRKAEHVRRSWGEWDKGESW